MPDEFVREYPKMLSGGMWCIMQMEYFRLEDELEDELADIFDEPRKPRSVPKRSAGPEDTRSRSRTSPPSRCPGSTSTR